MIIVLDKSFLMATPGQKMKELCTSDTVIMTEALLFELLTTAPEERATCFRKFPSTEKPVVLATNSGVLMRKECLNGRPTDLMRDSDVGQPFRFNQGLSTPTFSIDKRQQDQIGKWQSFMDDEVRNFKEVAGLVAGFFPELKRLKPGSAKEDVQFAFDSLSGDSEKVRDIYDQIRLEGVFPTADEISPDWIVYRHLQANLIAAVEYIRKYGSGTIDAQSKKIENDVVDIEYCILGTLADALASGDSTLKEMYLLSKPGGAIIQ